MAKKEDREPVVGAPQKAHPNASELFILGLYELLAIALDKKNRRSKAAGKVLAIVDGVIAENHKKLCATNEAYKRERMQLGKPLRSAVWFPESPLYQALHRELWHCGFYRGDLQCPSLKPKWEAEDYRPVMKLPRLSLKSFPRWEKELWKLIKKHNLVLLPKLRQKTDRKQVVPFTQAE